MSHRSGETEDNTIVAVALNCGQIKQVRHLVLIVWQKYKSIVTHRRNWETAYFLENAFKIK
jgi:hypothetical protein